MEIGRGMRPFEKIHEVVMFKAFIERGLAIPVCDFLHGLLLHWGIQLHHLTPNSILHLSIFVHLCEAFLGIHPHFDLFKRPFTLNPYPDNATVARVGGVDHQLRPEVVDSYIQYEP